MIWVAIADANNKSRLDSGSSRRSLISLGVTSSLLVVCLFIRFFSLLSINKFVYLVIYYICGFSLGR